jgi:hypothetical protein
MLRNRAADEFPIRMRLNPELDSEWDQQSNARALGIALLATQDGWLIIFSIFLHQVIVIVKNLLKSALVYSSLPIRSFTPVYFFLSLGF